MWPLIFTQAARAELIEAQDWYESEAAGLGRRFRVEIDRAVQRIVNAPYQFPVVFKTLRRARVKRFPYALLFLDRGRHARCRRVLSRQPRSAEVAEAGLSRAAIDLVNETRRASASGGEKL